LETSTLKQDRIIDYRSSATFKNMLDNQESMQQQQMMHQTRGSFQADKNLVNRKKTQETIVYTLNSRS